METNHKEFETCINNTLELFPSSQTNPETDVNNNWNYTHYTEKEFEKLNEHIKL